MNGYSAEERRQIAAGQFFTAAELAHRPGLGRAVKAPTATWTKADPNTRPVSTEAHRLAEDPGVCAYCREAPDARSQLNDQAMHTECAEAWELERRTR